jgi:hypothetical protein
LLNRAARYFPILREIRGLVDLENGVRVLEVGSGSIGIGEFWRHSFVGCDVTFPGQPRAPMQAVRGSGSQLPFADGAFDIVVASDVLEHVPPDWRETVISEVLRVSRAVAVFGYPCGALARDLDAKLHERYVSRQLTPPGWLVEHMLYPFPDERLFSRTFDNWKVKSVANESLDFHYRMMRLEMYLPLNLLFQFALAVMPKAVERYLRRVDREPSYRKIFVLSRR